VNLGVPRSRRAIGLAAATLTLGLTCGSAATIGLAQAADDARSAGLALHTAGVRGALGSALQRYEDTMHDLAAVATTPALPRTVRRITGERLPGAHDVLVAGADLRVLALHAADGSTPPRATLLTPEPELARAMAVAEQHGRPVASTAHVLPADAGLPPEQRPAGFELAAPVRDGTFRGWVIVSVRAADLLDAALRTAGVTGVTATLTETGHEIARWSGGGTAQGPVRRFALPIAGQTWQVVVRPTAPLVGTARSAAAPLALLGTVLGSVAVAAAVLAAASRHPRNTGAVDTTLPGSTGPAEEAYRRREAELAGFAVTASEHLHAPLHTIAGFTELLLEDAAPGLGEESRGFLLRIDGATRRMLAVVDDLLAYASAGDAALAPEPVEASLLALDVAAAHLPGPSIEIGELPAIAGDAALLRQVLDELVGNAVRFVRNGAPARISVGARELPGGWWRIEVADRGIGVPAEHRDRIFAPFHRAPAAESYPGTGLGLAVCARILALHGGEIGVEPNPGGGSVFWFTVAGAELGTRELTPSRT
jgi:signal transduction histidine kinase